jgi:tetratricopeptide (TPR) repeat protein
LLGVIKRKELGENHPDVADRLLEIAKSLQRQDQYDEALAKYMEALDIKRKTVGPDHPSLVALLKDIGA